METAVALPTHFLVFDLDTASYALPIEIVERVIPAVWISAIGGHSRTSPGVISIHNSVMPVIDLRSVLGMEGRSLLSSDHFVVIEIDGRRAALWIGATFEALDASEDGDGEPVRSDDDGTLWITLSRRGGIPVAVLDPETFID